MSTSQPESASNVNSTEQQIEEPLKNVLCMTNKEATKRLCIDEIHGYDLNNGLDYNKLLQTYRTTGFQATNFAKACDEVNRMVSKRMII
jgi:deoxyhypusine synthase